MNCTRWTSLVTLAFGVAACGSEGADGVSNNEGANGASNGTVDGLVDTLDEGDGVFATQVDAVDDTAWVYVDLDRGGVEEVVSDLGASTTWDLAFRRSNVKVNGGHSGPADVAVAALPEVDFDGLESSPVALFEVDRPSQGEVDPERPSFIDDDGTDFVFGRANAASTNGWYDYDPINHVLSPSNVTFIVRSSEGAFFKLRFLDYYNAAGTSGYPTFRWAEVSPPPGPQRLTVDASSRETFVYVGLEAAELIEVAEPSQSDGWDVAFRRTLVRTNSGFSGPGWGGAREENGYAFDAIDVVGTVGFRTDALVPPPGPHVPQDQWKPANETMSNWFDYDPVNHTVSPRDTVFSVRSADGDVYKVQILGWEDGQYELEVAAVPKKPDVRAESIDVSDESWTLYSLRLGEVVEVEAPEESLAWDIAFRGDEIRLNGGDSGPGDAAAVAVDSTLSEVVRVPDDGFVADQGGVNPVLSTWQDEASTFVLRLADGTFAKVRIDGANGAAWSFEYAYAGPGRRSFR